MSDNDFKNNPRPDNDQKFLEVPPHVANLLHLLGLLADIGGLPMSTVTISADREEVLATYEYDEALDYPKLREMVNSEPDILAYRIRPCDSPLAGQHTHVDIRTVFGAAELRLELPEHRRGVQN